MLLASWFREILDPQHERARRRSLIVGALALFLLAPGSGRGKTIAGPGSDLRLPEHFGEVVYQGHRDQENRVYIIAQSHRSAISGKENNECQEVQAEIYRIGEWLIANEQVEAILPEGYLSDPLPATGLKSIRPRGAIWPSGKLDDATLAALLANPAAALSADRLLYHTHDLALRQVEDRGLFYAVTNQLRTLLSASPRHQHDPTALPLLLFQQQKRSATILANLPGALAGENPAAGRPIRRAMLTIGLSHVDTMIDLLKNGKAQILPPPGMADRVTGYTCDLTGVKERYAIFVIIPRKLKRSRERLRQPPSPAPPVPM